MKPDVSSRTTIIRGTPRATGAISIQSATSSVEDPAHVSEGDLVVGLHRWHAEGRAAAGPLVILWILAADRETIGERFRLPAHILSRSRVVP